jgi:hypothetical protein
MAKEVPTEVKPYYQYFSYKLIIFNAFSVGFPLFSTLSVIDEVTFLYLLV